MADSAKEGEKTGKEWGGARPKTTGRRGREVEERGEGSVEEDGGKDKPLDETGVESAVTPVLEVRTAWERDLAVTRSEAADRWMKWTASQGKFFSN